MYAISRFCCGLPFWLVFLFSARCLSAAVSLTYTDNGGTGGLPRVQTGTIGFTPSDVAGVVHIKATWYHASNPVFSMTWSYRTKRNGVWTTENTIAVANGQQLFPPTTFPLPGDGCELVRQPTAAKPTAERKFVELYTPNESGTVSLNFSATNTSGAAKWFGVTDGLVTFGLTLVAPGGGFSSSITVSDDDTRQFQIVEIDMPGFSGSSDNNGGPGHVISFDLDGDGITNGKNDGFVIPNTYLTGVGSPLGASSGVAAPPGLANNAPSAERSQAAANAAATGSTAGGAAHSIGNVNIGGGVGSGTGGGALQEGTASSQLAQINANLVSIQKTIAAQGPNGGGSGGGGEVTVDVDVSGVETRLDTANESLGVLEENATSQKEAKDDAPTVEQMQSEGTTAAEGIGELIPVLDQPAPSGISGSSPSFTISFPVSMGGGTYDLDPFKPSRFGGLIDWFRSACAWTVIGFFAFWASMEVKEWVKASAALPQAKGNAVFGGTGAQLTALAAAGLITVVVGGFLVALIAWLGGEFAMPALLSALDDSPLTGAPATAAWMLNRCFPVETMVAAICVRAAWNFFATSIFAVAATAIRFIVP